MIDKNHPPGSQEARIWAPAFQMHMKGSDGRHWRVYGPHPHIAPSFPLVHIFQCKRPLGVRLQPLEFPNRPVKDVVTRWFLRIGSSSTPPPSVTSACRGCEPRAQAQPLKFLHGPAKDIVVCTRIPLVLTATPLRI